MSATAEAPPGAEQQDERSERQERDAAIEQLQHEAEQLAAQLSAQYEKLDTVRVGRFLRTEENDGDRRRYGQLFLELTKIYSMGVDAYLEERAVQLETTFNLFQDPDSNGPLDSRAEAWKRIVSNLEYFSRLEASLGDEFYLLDEDEESGEGAAEDDGADPGAEGGPRGEGDNDEEGYRQFIAFMLERADNRTVSEQNLLSTMEQQFEAYYDALNVGDPKAGFLVSKVQGAVVKRILELDPQSQDSHSREEVHRLHEIFKLLISSHQAFLDRLDPAAYPANQQPRVNDIKTKSQEFLNRQVSVYEQATSLPVSAQQRAQATEEAEPAFVDWDEQRDYLLGNMAEALERFGQGYLIKALDDDFKEDLDDYIRLTRMPNPSPEQVQQAKELIEGLKFVLQVYRQFIGENDDPGRKMQTHADALAGKVATAEPSRFSRADRLRGGPDDERLSPRQELDRMLQSCETKYGDLWTNKEWQGRFLAGSVIDMLSRAPESVVAANPAWQKIKASSPDGTQNEDFWYQIDQMGAEHASTPELRLAKIKSILNQLANNGVGIPKPSRPVETTQQYEQRMAEANSPEKKAERVAAIERTQLVRIAELEALWSHLAQSDQEVGLNLLGNGPKFTGQDIPGYVRQVREQLKTFNDNRPVSSAKDEVMQAEQVLKTLDEIKQQIIAKLNARQPGRANNILLQVEAEQRANGMAPGREGQSERPSGHVSTNEAAAAQVDSLDDEKRQELVGRESTRRRRRETDQLLQSLQAMDGSNPMQIQQALDAAGFTKSKFETIADGDVITRSMKFKIGNVVVEMVRTALDKTAFGITNVTFETNAQDRLVATKEAIERTNVKRFEGADLLDDRLGAGDSIKLHLVTESQDVYKVECVKGKWVLTGYPTVGKPVSREFSEEELKKMHWAEKRPVLEGLANGSGPIKDIHIVYGNSRNLAHDKEFKQNLARIPLADRNISTGGAGRTYEDQWVASATGMRRFARKWSLATKRFLREG